MSSEILDLEKIKRHQRAFASDRDWDQFHTPKNLTMALAGEAGELLEIFQWLTEAQSKTVCNDTGKREEICDELADILFYVIRLSDVLGIDLNDAFWKKTEKSAKKYPVELARGNAKKYTEFNK